ncbi:DNA-binding transcriptional regulator, LysR family [Alteromonadaceae bacterium Bs31]|nr:DNA-binding transcriptional regulator, LysR family [Alteromonadaceae bacterium Bs31]
MISIEQLKILVTVAEGSSLKQAADKLFKTQPAISLAIKQMEAQLGIALFNREGYRLALNEHGQILYQKAKLALSAHNDVLLTAQQFGQGYEAKIVVAVEASFELQEILPALEEAQQKYPHTQIVITQQYISGALEMLEREEASLAISPEPLNRMSPIQIESRHLLNGKMINVATPKLLERHPALTSVKQLLEEYQVVVQDSGSGTKGINFSVQTAQRHWYVNNFSAKLTLIESGMGWGRLPEFLVARQLQSGSLISIELDDFPSTTQVEYNLVRRSSGLPGPVANYLWEELKTGCL